MQNLQVLLLDVFEWLKASKDNRKNTKNIQKQWDLQVQPTQTQGNIDIPKIKRGDLDSLHHPLDESINLGISDS